MAATELGGEKCPLKSACSGQRKFLGASHSVVSIHVDAVFCSFQSSLLGVCVETRGTLVLGENSPIPTTGEH